MISVLGTVWALLLGILLIMLGNGMQFTLIGLRGDLEGFSTAALAVITSGYYIGFLSGARVTPVLIRRVGHVRVFAALGSFMSAGLIALPLATEIWAWTLLRLIIGFCMSGVYVSAESWLNHAATNDTRGKVLSAYMFAQTLGVIGAQWLLTLGDAATSGLFIVASILVSLSFGPILLSVSPTPAVKVTRAMSLRELFGHAPLSTVGTFLLGSIYATQSGMGAVFGTQIGLSTPQIALFVAMLFAGALFLQFPIGWLSDIMDRRKLILGAAALGAAACVFGLTTEGRSELLLIAAFLAGGVTTPLYSLFLAYANDDLPADDMPAASGGLVFVFGIGAIGGPLLAGWAMQLFGPQGFWFLLAVTFGGIVLYALYRMTQRPPLQVKDTDSYLNVLPTTSMVAIEAATSWAVEHAEGEQSDKIPG
ncbi:MULTISPECIES: MFS transporter [unclassified Salipiger]|uniref:MFS transporter n=1 Tax=unclassified Salipiger TaxID=2640570 RepID=UPI0013B650F0|nr:MULTISPECIES: MFS transporter [unclassified Salipiger]NDV51385.1 MFS transporter [Salipiger sp. PrR003]NDW32978.1 MFS transporter [Salipiger sp. PrR007]